MKVTTSLIISTYNWVEALDLVLNSLQNQTLMPSEVIIADDGSTESTKVLIDSYSKKISIPIKHIWHEDKGFRKAEILNKAIASAKSEYIIQIDGDCIMHPNFIKNHTNFSESNTYLYGSRVNILENYLDTLFKKKKVFFNAFSKGIKNRTRALYLPFLRVFYKSETKFSSKYRGCNTSFFKSDFIKVNGYNEDFQGWGREDSELAVRFSNNGIKSKRIRYQGIVYHIYHQIKSKENLLMNDNIEKQSIELKVKRTKNGIDKYLQ